MYGLQQMFWENKIAYSRNNDLIQNVYKVKHEVQNFVIQLLFQKILRLVYGRTALDAGGITSTIYLNNNPQLMMIQQKSIEY